MTGGAFCGWLPGVVSQSAVVWDVVGLEMLQAAKGHTRIRFLPQSPAAS
jgi:hypothetical protein